MDISEPNNIELILRHILDKSPRRNMIINGMIRKICNDNLSKNISEQIISIYLKKDILFLIMASSVVKHALFMQSDCLLGFLEEKLQKYGITIKEIVLL